MRKKTNKKTIAAIFILLLFAAGIGYTGYRVVLTSDEKPGKLTSVSVAVSHLRYSGVTMKKAQKVSYDTMKYGYMDDLMLAQMDKLDSDYENIRMEEIRSVNNLTAMSDYTEGVLAYQEAEAQRQEEIKAAAAALLAAEQAKQAKIKSIQQQIESATTGVISIDTGDSSDTGYGDTASRGGQVGEPVYASTHGASLGTYVITAYCTCRVCCGVYSGGNRTASGTIPTSNHTIAVDTSDIPFGTKVVINGQVYVAEDRGGDIKGKRIDMFFMTHKEALKWGRRSMEVYLAE